MFVSLKRPDDFIALAERGIFVYDWQDTHRINEFSNCYEIITTPLEPINKTECTEKFPELIWAAHLGEIDFKNTTTINIQDFVRCCKKQNTF